MEAQWRTEVSEDLRKQMITEMYHELLRISGENDKQKVWGSAAKFELMLWSNSTDQTTYMTKMQRKIVSLRRKPGAGEANAATGTSAPTAPQQQPQQPLQPSAPAQVPNPLMQPQVNPAAALAQLQQQQYQAALQNANAVNSFQHTNAAAAPTPNVLPATTAPAANATTNPALSTQQAQQWLQRLQVQFHAQQQQLLRAQQQETQQLRHQQLQQQQQLALQQQQQAIGPEARRQQLQTLQQQHEVARNRMQQVHKSKQTQLQRKQQQYLLQKQQQLQARGTVAPATGAASASTSVNPPNGAVRTAATTGTTPSNVKPEVVTSAQDQQAQMRAMQRAQVEAEHAGQSLPHATSTTTPATAVAPSPSPTPPTTTTTPSVNPSYVERLQQLKTKYWDDLVIVYKEFERMIKQKAAGPQQERLNGFLVTLRRVIALLQQDPSKPTTNTLEDLNRVEAHIHKQVLPILERLKHKTQMANTNTNGSTPAPIDPTSLDEQQKRQLQIDATTALAKKQQETLELARKQKQLLQAQAAARQAQQQQLVRQQQLRMNGATNETPSPATSPPAMTPGTTVTPSTATTLTPAQYKSFKLPEAQKQRLTAQHAKLREQHQEILMQQTHANTPTLQAKCAQQAHKIAQLINKIQQQLVQCKVAEEYEQAQLKGDTSNMENLSLIHEATHTTAVQGTLDGTSSIDSPQFKLNAQFQSVIPDLTGLSASEKLLTAVAAYEKQQPDVLRRASTRFSRIAVAIGAKLTTSYA